MQRRFESRSVVSASAATLALVAAFAACVTDSVGTATCHDENGAISFGCPAGWLCTAAGDGCYPAGCGDGVVDRANDEVCDDGNTESGDGCGETCLVLENCGDGKPDPGETCDDGNTVSGDGCSKDCQSTEACGDVILNPGEQCDEGKETPLCDDDCTLPRCGDGNLNMGFENPDTGLMEQCDEQMSTANCDADCTPVECGDGFHNTAVGVDGVPIEECDDGENDILTDECLPECKRATCGDGYTWAGVEECDDGSGADSAECDADCTAVVCGDAHPNAVAGELCDDGNDSVFDSCPSGLAEEDEIRCQPARCGDGFLRIGFEQCDDGNADNTDNCPSGVQELDHPICQPARCGDGYVKAGPEACDDGNGNNRDACPDGVGGTCQPASCGDGFVQAGTEECDDGNQNTFDACPDGVPGLCQLARCGDGFTNVTAREACDPGPGPDLDPDPEDNSTCDSDCTPASCGDGHLNTAAGEACDDGNRSDIDGCLDSSFGNCQIARCGDGILRLGFETCDDGNNVTSDACPSGVSPNDPRPQCQPARCGDGFTRSDLPSEHPDAEQCDQRVDTSVCNGPNAGDVGCKLPECGDGYFNRAAEQCEAGVACPSGTGLCNENTCQCVG